MALIVGRLCVLTYSSKLKFSKLIMRNWNYINQAFLFFIIFIKITLWFTNNNIIGIHQADNITDIAKFIKRQYDSYGSLVNDYHWYHLICWMIISHWLGQPIDVSVIWLNSLNHRITDVASLSAFIIDIVNYHSSVFITNIVRYSS